MDNYNNVSVETLTEDTRKAVTPFRFTVPSMNIGDQKRLISQMVRSQGYNFNIAGDLSLAEVDVVPLMVVEYSTKDDVQSTYLFQWYDADYCVITKIVRIVLSSGEVLFTHNTRYGTNVSSIVYNFNELLQLEATVETTEREVSYLKTFNKITWK
jgi:hypothetical protein